MSEIHTGFGSNVRDAVRYWERRRVVYNAVLVVIGLSQAFTGRIDWEIDGALSLFLSAVAANVLFCLAYVGDLVVQQADEPQLTRAARLTMFLVGTATAATMTYFVTSAMFHTRP